MRLSAVFACVRVIAETQASLPWILYKKLKPNGREEADTKDVYTLLKQEPNDIQTPMEFMWTERSEAEGTANLLEKRSLLKAD